MAYDQLVMGPNPGTKYWMDISNVYAELKIILQNMFNNSNSRNILFLTTVLIFLHCTCYLIKTCQKKEQSDVRLSSCTARFSLLGNTGFLDYQ